MNARGRTAKPLLPDPRRAPGRPRSDDADRAILEATVGLLSEVGIEQTTVSEVIARSGVARATVYRRWPTREALIEAALSEVKGRPPFPLSGDLEADLARAVEQAREVFAEPRFQAFLPILVRDLLRDRAKQGVSATLRQRRTELSSPGRGIRATRGVGRAPAGGRPVGDRRHHHRVASHAPAEHGPAAHAGHRQRRSWTSCSTASGAAAKRLRPRRSPAGRR